MKRVLLAAVTAVGLASAALALEINMPSMPSASEIISSTQQTISEAMGGTTSPSGPSPSTSTSGQTSTASTAPSGGTTSLSSGGSTYSGGSTNPATQALGNMGGNLGWNNGGSNQPAFNPFSIFGNKSQKNSQPSYSPNNDKSYGGQNDKWAKNDWKDNDKKWDKKKDWDDDKGKPHKPPPHGDCKYGGKGCGEHDYPKPPKPPKPPHHGDCKYKPCGPPPPPPPCKYGKCTPPPPPESSSPPPLVAVCDCPPHLLKAYNMTCEQLKQLAKVDPHTCEGTINIVMTKG